MTLPQEATYTLADILSWDEDVRAELITGELVMLATPTRRHQEVSGELFGQLREYLKGKNCKVYHAPFSVRLFETDRDDPENVDTVVEPDLAVIRDPSKLDDIGCKGAPDLMIEILSPSSKRHDMVTKFNLYRRAGVREYWIVDPDGKTVQTYILENGYYIAGDLASPGDKLPVNVLDGCIVDLTQVFD